MAVALWKVRPRGQFERVGIWRHRSVWMSSAKRSRQNLRTWASASSSCRPAARRTPRASCRRGRRRVARARRRRAPGVGHRRPEGERREDAASVCAGGRRKLCEASGIRRRRKRCGNEAPESSTRNSPWRIALLLPLDEPLRPPPPQRLLLLGAPPASFAALRTARTSDTIADAVWLNASAYNLRSPPCCRSKPNCAARRCSRRSASTGPPAAGGLGAPPEDCHQPAGLRKRTLVLLVDARFSLVASGWLQDVEPVRRDTSRRSTTGAGRRAASAHARLHVSPDAQLWLAGLRAGPKHRGRDRARAAPPCGAGHTPRRGSGPPRFDRDAARSAPAGPLRFQRRRRGGARGRLRYFSWLAPTAVVCALPPPPMWAARGRSRVLLSTTTTGASSGCSTSCAAAARAGSRRTRG